MLVKVKHRVAMGPFLFVFGCDSIAVVPAIVLCSVSNIHVF